MFLTPYKKLIHIEGYEGHLNIFGTNDSICIYKVNDNHFFLPISKIINRLNIRSNFEEGTNTTMNRLMSILAKAIDIRRKRISKTDKAFHNSTGLILNTVQS